MRQRATVLLVAEQRQMRDGLRALLRAIPGVEVIDRSCGGALDVDLIADYHPDLVLVSCNLHEKGTRDALKQIRVQRPKVGFLLLVDDVTQQRLAWKTGADRVLIKGTSAEKLMETIKQLLSQEVA